MKRPSLREIPMASFAPGTPGMHFITMSPGQWDSVLKEAYDLGWTLIEIVNERPTRTFRKAREEIAGDN